MTAIRRVLLAAVLPSAMAAASLAWTGAANADVLGGVDVVPTKGNAETLISVVTERGCQEPAERVSAVLTGPGLPRDGQIVVSPSELLFSTTRPMELPLSNAFVVYADRNSTPLQGTYTIAVRCTDRIGVTVVDEFRTTMSWSTPGGTQANVAKATFVAKSTAGVVAGRTASASPAPSASTTAPTPGEQPLADDERADGSNPVPGGADAAGSSEADDGDGSDLRNVLLLGGGLVALLVAGVLALRGRGRPRTTSGDAA
jgi:hypothetical protein